MNRWALRWVGVAIALICVATTPSAASAQRIRDIPDKVDVIYQLVPTLPDRETNEDWLQRVLLYHIRTQGRLASSRFDWRLTFADYLGANLPMYAQQYPPGDSDTSPLNGDRELFRSMTRQQRNELLAALMDVYGSESVANTLQLADQASPDPSTSVTIDE